VISSSFCAASISIVFMALTVKFTNDRDYILVAEYVSETRTSNGIRKELLDAIDRVDWRKVDRAHSVENMAGHLCLDAEIEIIYDGAPEMWTDTFDMTLLVACDSTGVMPGWVLNDGDTYRFLAVPGPPYSLVDLWDLYFTAVTGFIEMLHVLLQWERQARGRDISADTVVETLGSIVRVEPQSGDAFTCRGYGVSLDFIWSYQQRCLTEIRNPGVEIAVRPLKQDAYSYALQAAMDCCSSYDPAAVNSSFRGLLDSLFVNDDDGETSDSTTVFN
jgi:hypothetical protein